MSIVAAFMVPHPPLIIPAVGQGREEEVRETIDSYLAVAEEIAKARPETIIISSHLLAELSELCTDYIIINEGRIVESLSREELMYHSRSYISIRTDRLEEMVATLEKKLMVQDYKVMETGEVRLYEYIDHPEQVSRTITDAGFTILRFAETSDSLEEYYLSKVTHNRSGTGS